MQLDYALNSASLVHRVDQLLPTLLPTGLGGNFIGTHGCGRHRSVVGVAGCHHQAEDDGDLSESPRSPCLALLLGCQTTYYILHTTTYYYYYYYYYYILLLLLLLHTYYYYYYYDKYY